MQWFKHFVHWHNDPDISDGYKKFEHLSCVYFICVLEAYAECFDSADHSGYVPLSLGHISRRCHTLPRRFLEVSAFFRERNRIQYHLKGDFICLKVIGFENLIGTWRAREKLRNVTTPDHACDGEEKKGEKEWREEKKDDLENAALEILEYFNKKTGKSLNNYDLILSLLRGNRSREDFFRIIDLKTADPFFQKNRKLYNLHTLFDGDRFDTYLAECRDSASIAKPPEPRAAAAASGYNFWRLNAAYFHYLKKEFPVMQDTFRSLIDQLPELTEYISRSGVGRMLEKVAVHSIGEQKIVLFPLTGANDHLWKFIDKFTELTGISVSSLLDVPKLFIDSECFQRYYEAEEASYG